MPEQKLIDINTGKYLTHLIKCALENAVPEEIPSDTDWLKVFFAAKQSSLEGITYISVEKLRNKPEERLFDHWKNVYSQIVYREVRFDFERQNIFEKMHENGLSYLPLKGINLLRFYPKAGMRSMCDNDILYGQIERGSDGIFRIKGKNEEERAASLREAQDKLVSVMTSLGFEVGSLVGHDERFTKGSLLFEMHRSLVPPNRPYFKYYENSWQRAIQSADDPNRFSYSREDEYIYTVVHTDKHLKTSGTGLRSIVDLYVFLKSAGDKLDRDYVDGELEKLGISDVEKRLRSFAFSLFEGNELSDDDGQMLLFFLNCGTYGNFDEMMRQNLNRLGAEEKRGKAKFAYLKKRLFPDISNETLKRCFPAFYKHRALRPFLPVYRVFRGFFKNTRYFFREVGYLFSRRKDLSDKEKKDI
ncbi:MAG: nucleotidyltransferase family protein [Eubacteriales bacterium]|nr:nucleotidyltransferase family protein [Eubacteriales bacterium]